MNYILVIIFAIGAGSFSFGWLHADATPVALWLGGICMAYPLAVHVANAMYDNRRR